jgi:hypothetical protein
MVSSYIADFGIGKTQIPNSRTQIPRPKNQIPRPRIQIPLEKAMKLKIEIY